MLVTTSASSTQTCALFERQGTADDGGEFDLVLMDRDLHNEMTGTELLDHLAARYGVMLPALIISGTADFRVVLDLQESGYPWLAKPVSMPVLLREMQRVIQHERPDVSLRG
jgi:CheY-like chemotaxis protein